MALKYIKKFYDHELDDLFNSGDSPGIMSFRDFDYWQSEILKNDNWRIIPIDDSGLTFKDLEDRNG